MLTVRFFDDVTQDWGEIIQPNTDGGLQIPVVRTDRFDEGLSVADIKIYTNGHDMPVPVPEWTKCRMDYDGEIVDYFVSFCDTEVLARGEKPIYQVELSLIELVKVTQSLMMDSLCFSNDVSDTGVVTTRTIGAVLTRLNNQLFTVPEEDKRDVPFKFFFEPTEAWVGYTAPELFFTEQTLFEALEQIGQVIGGFPYLEYVSSGTYRLKFRMWDNPNTTHWETDEYQQIYEHTGIEGQANVVDSTVKNLLNVSENGENTAVYPAYDGYKAVSTESSLYVIETADSFLKLPHPIAKVIKMECRVPSVKKEGDYSRYIVEFDKWKTLRRVAIFPYPPKQYQNTCAYYIYNTDIINIQNIKWIAKEIGTSDTSIKKMVFKITYIPMISARIKKQRMSNEPMKPIMQPVNQPANIVNGGAYSTHLQGLVNRMSGYYRQIVKVIFRDFANPTHTLYKIGDWLNGQIITEAEHTYTNVNIISSYKTSREFNRRSEYVSFPHNIRQWSIPADDKVSDRNLHYSENLEFSIGEKLSESNGLLTGYGRKIACNFTAKTEKIVSLAYLAWKHQKQIDVDADDQSTNYALASCSPIPMGRSIIMSWSAEDNGSMGSRSYDKFRDDEGPAAADDEAERQVFISYPSKDIYFQFKIANDIPSFYNFNTEYTGTNDEGSTNANFWFTFPMSNKQQYQMVAPLFYTGIFKIEKDLRERILFNFQLDFVGKNGTIVYDRACTFSGLSNAQNTSLKVFSSETPYDIWSTVGDGEEKNIKEISYGDDYIKFTLEKSGDIKNLAVTDKNNFLLFAINKTIELDSDGSFMIYFGSRKKEWVKI